MHIALRIQPERLEHLLAAAEFIDIVLIGHVLVECLRLLVRQRDSVLQLVNAAIETLHPLNPCLLFIDTPHTVYHVPHVATQAHTTHIAMDWLAIRRAETRKPVTLCHSRMQIVCKALKVELLVFSVLKKSLVRANECLLRM